MDLSKYPAVANIAAIQTVLNTVHGLSTRQLELLVTRIENLRGRPALNHWLRLAASTIPNKKGNRHG